jgi:glutamate racemase
MVRDRTSPIGVFDSGLGGLSVLKELHVALPGENFLYLGDVARLPYGTKSESVVTRYVRRCLQFLLDREVKLIVIACNTATAMALPSVRGEIPVPVHGVIEAGVRAGLVATRRSRILVLGTEATVKSGAYPAEFFRQGFAEGVEQIACPLLVPLAEEGWFDHPVTAQVITSYLERARDPEYDVVVLGCTHYPLLEPSFRRVLGETRSLVHAGRFLAEEVSRTLLEQDLLHPATRGGNFEFFSTDHTSSPFLSRLFRQPVTFELVDL